MKKIMLAILFLFSFVTVAYATDPVVAEGDGSIRKCTYPWTSNAAGNYDSGTSFFMNGAIYAIRAVESTGANTPSDQYDVILLDKEGNDVLIGAGQNIQTSSGGSTGTTSWATPVTAQGGFVPLVNEPTSLKISNAGSVKSGIFEVYLWK
jgi:hypothetical protein